MRPLAYRIVLSEKCNASCPHCFNANARNQEMMDIDKFLEFAEINKENTKISTLKVMGGEPTLHPRFLEFMDRACQYFMHVNLFTNGIKLGEFVSTEEMSVPHSQGRITYTINGYTFNISDFKKYEDHVRVVIAHMVIKSRGNTQLIEKMEDMIKSSKKIRFMISPDTQINLTDNEKLEDYREVWMDNFMKIEKLLLGNNIAPVPDHYLPACFFTQEMQNSMEVTEYTRRYRDITCCFCSEIGLIHHNFDLSFCNQTSIKLGSILHEDGVPKTIPEIQEMIGKAHTIKEEKLRLISEKCAQCPAITTCKAGCFFNAALYDFINNQNK